MNNRLNVTALNLMASENIRQMIQFAEKKYHSQFAQIAAQIASDKQRREFILVAGPSGSGKTFSSYILKEHLHKNHIPSQVISLDNFYKDRDQMPLLEDGKRDFECLEALDIAAFHSCIFELLDKRKTQLPHFSFTTGKCSRLDKMQLEEDEILIIEGIHALNPALLPEDTRHHFHRYYIDVKTQYDDMNGQVLLSARDIRLLRRIIRDYRHRDASVSDTLQLWKSVLKGERRWITPYICYADRKIDSAHLYEPMLYRQMFSDILPDSLDEADREVCDRLMRGLSYFDSVSPDRVPDNSLLVEFIR